MSSQFFNLIPVLDAIENTALPLILDGVKLEAARTKAKEWLSKNKLERRGSHHPNELSGGQQQRVVIVRAMVADPLIVMADEPTRNLDSRSGDEIASALHKWSLIGDIPC